MSLVKAKEYLQKYGLEDKIMEFDVSSATVEKAAKAINCNYTKLLPQWSFKIV